MSRYFFALSVSDEDKQTIRDWCAPLHSQTDARWVAPENYHVTIAYLGETRPDVLTDVIQYADAELDIGALPFRWNVNHVSRFRSGVLYISGYNTPPAMTRMAKTLDLLVPHEFQHKNFIPHITLARGANHVEAPVLDLTCVFDTLVLFESRTSDTGTTYVPVHRWPSV